LAAAEQVVLTLGIVIAQAINIGTQHIPNFGWRISLACAGIPALVLTLGGLLLPDTPNSLIERGHEEQGKQVRPSRLFTKSAAVKWAARSVPPDAPQKWCLGNGLMCGVKVYRAQLLPLVPSQKSRLVMVLMQVLRDIRGTENVEEEFNDIREACERAKLVINPWRTILKPSYAPQLFVAITATLFQQVLPLRWLFYQMTRNGISIGTAEARVSCCFTI
jgi:hypothetical protein